MADKLGYDKCRVYTHFFDTCWTEADGPKADVADIAIRMMTTGEGPREVESEELRVESGATSAINHQPSDINSIALQFKPDGVTDEEWLEHSSIMKAIREWNLEHAEDEPFLDADEMRDPQLRRDREKLRITYNFNY